MASKNKKNFGQKTIFNYLMILSSQPKVMIAAFTYQKIMPKIFTIALRYLHCY